MDTQWKASWIWCEGLDKGNVYLVFRKEFHLPEDELESASVRICADSRYVLYLNGQRIGRGPSRSWPWKQDYNLYEVKDRLRPGRNVIAIFVNHFGISTFQYILGKGGLLCQIDWKSKAGEVGYLSTDESWNVTQAKEYSSLAPRLNCQMEYAEIYDARKALIGWTQSGFSHGDWAKCKVLGPVGIEPWTQLVERSIPFLTEEPIYPELIMETNITRSIPYLWTMDLREAFLPWDRTANQFQISGQIVVLLEGEKGGEAKIWRFSSKPIKIFLNGQGLSFNRRQLGALGEVANARLRPGKNILVMDVSGTWHYPTITLGIDTEDEIKPLSPESWAIANIPRDEETLKPMPMEAIRDIDVGILTSSAQILPGRNPKPEPLETSELADYIAMVYPSEDGDVEILLDFGRMLVGFIEFEVEAPRGAILDFNFFEGIQDGTRLYTPDLNNSLRYITRGGGRERFNSILRRGFRYASITLRNFKKPIILQWIRLLLNTYPTGERGSFLSSDPLLNKVWEMSSYTTRLCMEDTFVDCPTYEQAFWVGDARNEALINYYAFGDLKLPDRCWRLVAESLKRSHLPESQVPSGWQNILPAWSLLWIQACHEHYIYSGDKEYLKEIYSAMATTCKNFLTFINQDGLLKMKSWNMLDWAPMDTPNEGIITHQNALLVEALGRTAWVAHQLGIKDDEEYFLNLAQRLKEAINRHLWSDTALAYIDSIHADGTPSNIISQQTNTLIYLYDIATEERREAIKGYVKEVPPNWVEAGSPFMLFFVFEALAKQGEFKHILDTIRSKWGLMLERGSTTCWETFPKKDKSMWSRSFCHAWSAAPVYFLSAYQLGIRSLEPGFAKVLIAPEAVDLTWCQGRVPTPKGDVEIHWNKQKTGDFLLEFQLPIGMEGEVPPLNKNGGTITVEKDGESMNYMGETLHVVGGSRYRLNYER